MGFGVKVTKGAYPNKEAADLGAEEKTVKNLERALDTLELSKIQFDASYEENREHLALDLREARARFNGLKGN